jgi:hypothetical protein
MKFQIFCLNLSKSGLTMKLSHPIGEIYAGAGAEQEIGRYFDLDDAFIFALLSALYPQEGGAKLNLAMWTDKTKLRIEINLDKTKAKEIFEALQENKQETKDES